VAGFERLGEPGPLSCGLASLSVGPARAPWVPQDNGLLIHASGALLFRHVCISVSNDGRSQSNLVIILKKGELEISQLAMKKIHMFPPA
jgi:hypothetical protein